MHEPETTPRSATIRRVRDGVLIAGGAGLSLLGTASVLLCMLAVVGRMAPGSTPDYPSDDKLIARYMANKAEFGQLADMMIAEQEIAWVLDGNCQLRNQRIATGDEDDRCRAYLELCHDLGIESVAIGEEPFILYVGSWGGAMGGSALGYEYTSAPPSSNLVGDTRRPGDEWAGGAAYRHIEGNWYIFLWDG